MIWDVRKRDKGENERSSLALITIQVKMTSTSTLLQFSPFSLFPSPSFWNSLSTLQLDDLRLSDEPIAVTAAYDVGRWVIDRATGKEVSMGCRLGIEGDGLKGKQR